MFNHSSRQFAISHYMIGDIQYNIILYTVILFLAEPSVVLHLSSLRGETISTECLNSALRSIVERHSVLRTTVHEVVIGSSVSLVQRVHPPNIFEDYNIQTVLEDSDVVALIRDEMFKPFNLTEQQFRCTVLKQCN